jgi:transcriptional regulator with XRE-family HTH domain
MKNRLAQLLSERLRSLREAKGVSQQELATGAGLSMSLVAKLEQGKKADPRVSTLLALASALDATPGAMIDGLPADAADSPPEELEIPSPTADEALPKRKKKRKVAKKKVKRS